MAYLDAFPSSWSRKIPATSGEKSNDETLTIFIPTFGRPPEGDKSHSFSNDGFPEDHDVQGLSDECADPTADLVAAGVVVRDYAYVTDNTTAKEALTTTGQLAWGLDGRVSGLPRGKPDETPTLAPGPPLLQEAATAALLATRRAMSTASQLGKETVESDGRTAQYLSEFPESWLQPRRPNKTAHGAIRDSYQREKLTELGPPLFRQQQEPTPPPTNRPDNSSTRGRGSWGDVMPRHPGKRSKSSFVARGHFELPGAAAAMPAQAQKLENVTERVKVNGYYAPPPPKMNSIVVRDIQTRDSQPSTNSASSMASNYSTTPAYNGSRTSRGDKPQTFRMVESSN